MAYFQIGILVVGGLLVFGIFMGFFIDLNKDASFHNRRQRKMKPKLAVIRTRRKMPKPSKKAQHPQPPKKVQRPQQVKERRENGKSARGPRGPEKRR